MSEMEEPKRKGPGRKPFVVDWDRVDRYLQAHCDGVGIAGILGCAPETLYRKCQEEKKVNFEAYMRQKRAEGKALILKKQFDVAMSGRGDRSMLIYLGKVHCGQTEGPQQIDVTSGGQRFQGFTFLEPLAKPGPSSNGETGVENAGADAIFAAT